MTRFNGKFKPSRTFLSVSTHIMASDPANLRNSLPEVFICPSVFFGCIDIAPEDPLICKLFSDSQYYPGRKFSLMYDSAIVSDGEGGNVPYFATNPDVVDIYIYIPKKESSCSLEKRMIFAGNSSKKPIKNR